MANRQGSYDASYVNNNRQPRIHAEQSLPNGQKPDFGNGPQSLKKLYGKGNSSYNHSKGTNLVKERNSRDGSKKSADGQKNQQKKKQQPKSQPPLASPHTPQPVRAAPDYSYGSVPAQVNSQRPLGQVGGSTFMNSPDPGLLAKPSFL